jgi:hypothetical protein
MPLIGAASIAEHGSFDIAPGRYQGLEAVVASPAQLHALNACAQEQSTFPGSEVRQVGFKSHRLIFTIRVSFQSSPEATPRSSRPHPSFNSALPAAFSAGPIAPHHPVLMQRPIATP